MSTDKNDKWWYRLLKVVYVLFILSLVGITVAGAISSMPTLNEYGSRYQLTCDNGTKRGDFAGSTLNYGYSDFSDSKLAEFARFACHRTDLIGDELQETYREGRPYGYGSPLRTSYVPIAERIRQTQALFIPGEKNYKITLLEGSYYGSWIDAATILIVGLVVVLLIALFTRATFLYIAFKEPFWKNVFSIIKVLKIFRRRQERNQN